MKPQKIISVCLLFVCLTFVFAGCNRAVNMTNEELAEYAAQKHNFDDIIVLRISRTDNLYALINRGGYYGAYVVYGKVHDKEKLLVYPRDSTANWEPEVIDFPFVFSYSTCLEEARKAQRYDGTPVLRDDDGEFAFAVIRADIDVSMFDRNLALSHYGSYYICSLNGECRIIDEYGNFLN